MKINILLLTFTILFFSSCNFESASDDSSGGGLFSNHKPVTDIFTFTAPTDKTYLEAEVLNFELEHPFLVSVTGTPRLAITLGGSTVYADYTSGDGTNTLVFSYVVQSGDTDLDGIQITSNVDLNGGTIQYSNEGIQTDANLDFEDISLTGVLVDALAPNVLAVTPPTAQTYYVNQSAQFVVLFDDSVTITGSPQIELDIGGTTAYANYSSGSGSSTLTFNYIVDSSHIDSNGIEMVTPLSLNGGTIQDASTNDSALTFTPIPMPTIFVDGDTPYVSSITPPNNGSYTPGQAIEFDLVFTETVTITGAPRVAIDVGGNTRYADYLSGSASDTIRFRYIVTSGNVDNDGIEIGNTIDLNGGTIQDGSANNSLLLLTPPLTPAVLVNGILPAVTSITPPTNGTYNENDELYFTLTFNTIVNVTGFPQINMVLDSSSPASSYIVYSSGSGTNSLIFRYVVLASDTDITGITLNSPLELNGGTIQDANLTNADLNITTPIGAIDTTGILIDGIVPFITSITPPADDTYILAETLDFTVQFNENVNFTNTPRLAIDAGGSTVYADYLSGTGTTDIIFRYTVGPTDEDTDGITLTPESIDLNTSGTVIDDHGNDANLDFTGLAPAMPAVLIDGIVPTVTITTTDPINTLNNATYIIAGTCSENGRIVNIDIGGVIDTPTCTANAYTTSALDLSGLADGPTINITADHDDAAGNNAVQAAGSVVKDTVLSNITANAITAGTYSTGQSVDLVIDFDENVVVTGLPRVELTFNLQNTTPIYANYASGSGTNQLTFSYTVVSGDQDVDGIITNASIDLNSGNLTDEALNPSNLANVTTSFPTVLVSGILTEITSITATGGTYIISDDIDFTVTFSNSVTASATNSRIEVTMETQNTTPLYATYVSGTGTNTFIYRYTVIAGDEDLNGLALNAALDLNGDTLEDATGTGIDTTNPDTAFAAVLVDGIIPTVTITTTDAINTLNQSTFTVSGTCSDNGEAVNVDIGGVTDAPTCTANAYTTSALDLSGLVDGATINITADHDDTAGNSATQATGSVIKDTVLTNITANAITAGTYSTGQQFDIVIDFDENVVVTGTPRVELTMETQNTTPIYADYASGSGTNQLTFSYTVVSGDQDVNGLAINANLDLNSGAIDDEAGNPSNLANTTTAFPTVLVSGVLTEISSITATGATYAIGEDIDFTVTFSNSVTASATNSRIEVTMETQNTTPLYATYVSGTGTNTFIYRYTVVAGDEDLNGLALNAALDLNGDTLEDATGTGIDTTNPDTAFAAVLVDGIIPTVTITTTDAINTLNQSTFTVSGTCSDNGEAVNVDIGGVTDAPTCTANAYITSALDLSGLADGPTINITADHDDAGGNSATQATGSVIKDTVLTNITANAITAGTYSTGQQFDIVIDFDENVVVTGTPRVELTMETQNTTPIYADYASGSGTNQLTFSYTVVSGDQDVNGLAINANLDLNSGAIDDEAGNPSNLANTTTAFPTVLVSGVLTEISSITATGATYAIGEDIDFTVTFSNSVTASATNSRIEVTMETQNTTPLYATYVSGTGTNTFIYRYTVVAGDEDLNGLALNAALDLNGDTLEDATGTGIDTTNPDTAFAAVLVDGIVPTVTITTTDAINTLNQSTFTVSGTCSDNGEAVNIDIGGVTDTPTCTANAYTTSALDLSGLVDGATINITADHDDTAGNSATQATGSVIKDTVLTNITANAITAGTYSTGQQFDIVIDFDENVVVTGTPRVELTMETQNTTPIYADYASGSGTNQLTFSYTVVSGDQDVNGLAINANLDLNSGAIDDEAGNPSNLVNTTTAFPTVLVSGVLTEISSITATGATYAIGDDIDFTVTFSNAVTASATNSRIEVTMETQNTTPLYATYVSGTGTSTFVYRYTVIAGDEDLNGLALNAALDLNGDTLEDATGTGIDTTNPDTAFAAVLVDGIVPTVTITTTDAINTLNQSTFTVSGTCSDNGEAVNIDIGGVTDTPTCTANAYTTSALDLSGLVDGATINITADHDDTAGNSATQATGSVVKDTVIPTVTITSPSDINLSNVTGYTMAGTCSEDSETVNLDIGGVSATTNCSGGSWSLSATNVSAASDSATLPLTADYTDAAGNPATQATDSVVKDTALPTVTISSAPDITNANVATYSVSGTCSENGEIVTLNIDSITLTPTCSGGAYTTGSVDVSALSDSATLPITADHDKVNGNSATQATTTVDKNTALPTVAITSAPDITNANETAYTISGTCSENGRVVSVDIGGLSFSPNCSGGTWSIANTNVSSLSDNPAIAVTADHDDSGGSNATQATATIAKDSAAPTVTISAAPNINASNETSYISSGTCSENGRIVAVNIDSLTFTPTCSSGTWTTGSIDVSSIPDGGSISVTADHDNAGGTNATQATMTISKSTATPTISGLSVPTTLSDSADLSWSLVDPGGFTIDDYVINYRVKGTLTWLTFSDGVSTNIFATVDSLTESTIYEFRIAVKYDTTEQSDWSNTAEGETKPDNPIFSGANKVMNVGGATSSRVVAYEDTTVVTLNGVTIATLNKGDIHTFTSAQFDILDADKPIFVAGRKGTSGGGANDKGNIVWNPTSWGGRSFSFNATRFNAQKLHVYATENTTVQVYQGATLLDSLTLTSGNGGTLTWSVYGSYQVVSAGTILAFHYSNSTGSAYADPKPLPPSHTELIGFPSSSMRLTTDLDGTNYTAIHSNSTSASGSLNKADVIQINPQDIGSGTSLYNSGSLLITADKKISGASFADSNGYCASVFLPTNLMKYKYAVNTSADYIAFASKSSGTIQVLNSAGTVVETLTLTRSGANPNAPYRVRRGTTTAGYRFVATVPVAAWYQPNTDTGGGDEDETIMYGTNE